MFFFPVLYAYLTWQQMFTTVINYPNQIMTAGTKTMKQCYQK